MDYYSILGVNKSASPDEIKRAYRKLAMQHHPDRGGSADKLKEINEAYDTLKDATKRQQYDNPQPRMNSNYAQGNPNDFFEQMFRNFHSARQQNGKNRDIHLNADIELRDVVYGRLLIFEYRLQSGNKERVEIEVPRGIEDNQMVRYPGLGDDGVKQWRRGDLIVRFRTAPTKKWRRDGPHLHTTVDISALDAILGVEVEIETIENRKINLKIPAGTHPETVMNVAEYGLPILNNHRRGNMYVKIKVKTPLINDIDLLEKIKEVKDGIS